MSALAAMLATGLATVLAAPPPEPPHHILVLDDSGSMEIQYDVHGYGLAAPELFRRVLGDDGLAVFLLAQGGPRGPVPRLAAGDYLGYARENGTFYERAITTAITEAEAEWQRSPGRAVEILLVTDAEPSDADARAAIERALAAHPTLSFRCVLLATRAEGDLCRDRATVADDGFAMVQALTRDLAKSLGSIPRWGRLGGAQKETPLPLGRFVSRAHVLLLGARAGEDFAAEVVPAAGAPLAVSMAHTRALLPADLLRVQALTQGLGAAPSMPVGPSPRLALGTLTLDPARQALAGDLVLRLTRSDGDVAWGLLLEYDLVAAVEAPPQTTPIGPSATLPVTAHLTHRGAHVDDLPALAALGLRAELVVTPSCTLAPCPAARTLPLTLDAQGYAKVAVPIEPNVERYGFEARFTGDTADLRSAPVATAIVRAATTATTALPPAPVAATPPAPAPTPVSSPTPPAPAPTAGTAPAPQPLISRWIPPVLDLPEYQITSTELGYALTVTSFNGHALTGAEIQAERLGAALVVDGRELPMTLVGDRFELRFPVGAPGRREVRVRLLTPDGPLDSNADQMEVLADARVRLAPTTDLGLVPAGCGTTARCEPLDLSGSQALDGLPLEARRAAGTWPDATITLRRGDETWRLTRDAPVTVTPDASGSARALEVCVAPPGCSDAPADAHELVEIAPADPRLQSSDRVARTRVVAAVEPSTWLDCNLWWVVLVVGGLLTALIIYGYLRPDAFPAGAMVQVASGSDGERRLARDPGRPLRVVPHGRRGFYRTATCAFDGAGFTVKKSRPHVLLLRAQRGAQIALIPRGAAVERRTRGSWVPVDRRAERYLLSGTTYRINGAFYFKVLV